ncbi:MAG: hypothetical protein N4A76_10915 [Firmicutes bacterium]|jgi:hypothetical protein|nr:hypothetical protein [Bacillota bacterium]
MFNEFSAVEALISRYDYGGAMELMEDAGFENYDLVVVLDSCRYAINFDFKSAMKKLYLLSDEYKEKKEMKELKKNLEDLIHGKPDVILSELLENIKFQIVNEEYIDFLGRVYRFKEALFKYMFVKKNLNKNKFSFHVPMMSKRNILKVLRKKYKIYNSNLVYSISNYLNKYAKEDYKFMEVEKILNSERMNQLIELRNDSIVGHGFVGVSIDDIYKTYGNPYQVLDDFEICLKKLEIDIIKYKYSDLNKLLIEELRYISVKPYVKSGFPFE